MREKEVDGGANIALIDQIVRFALEREYIVILEGILNAQRYGSMLRGLSELCAEPYFYYFDVSFDETLRRHSTRTREFGPVEMRSWWCDRDLMHLPFEKVIPESSSAERTMATIMNDTGLDRLAPIIDPASAKRLPSGSVTHAG